MDLTWWATQLMVGIMKRWKERDQQILSAYSEPGNMLYRTLAAWKTIWETSRMCAHTFRLHSRFSPKSLQEGPSKSFLKALYSVSILWQVYRFPGETSLQYSYKETTTLFLPHFSSRLATFLSYLPQKRQMVMADNPAFWSPNSLLFLFSLLLYESKSYF